MTLPAPGSEWLEADGLGGFASGPVVGPRTRRYHALLLTAKTPPTGRFVLVNGCDAFVDTEAGRFAITAQRYAPDVISSDASSRVQAFAADPWPRWTLRLEDGTKIEHEVFVPKGLSLVVMTWRLVGEKKPATLAVRPFLSGRDYHALHHENSALSFVAEAGGDCVTWGTYASVPSTTALANGGYLEEPLWYRSFLYEDERARGLDSVEDLATPGTFRFDLERGEAVLIFAAEGDGAATLLAAASAEALLGDLRRREMQRRAEFASRLERAADAYLVKRDILMEWSHAVSEGMLPNRFQDEGDAPEFNSVDASLWFVIATHEYLTAMAAKGAAARKKAESCKVCGGKSGCLQAAVLAILDGYSKGTRHGIRMDEDGLLAAGAPGLQLTWMDAKVGDWVVTPRIGKPVEIQALWINALAIGADHDARWREPLARARGAFGAKFWNAERASLYDVVDADHEPGKRDAALRPNQILAVGGLPHALLTGEKARAVVDTVERELLTPLGLRSLARGEAGYTPRYEGGPRERDGCYHQGTVWPWLIGPFVEAWVAVRGGTPEAKAEARERFLTPILRHLDEAGIGHVSEIADAEPPHTPRGCPFQAWSVGEALRLDGVVLVE